MENYPHLSFVKRWEIPSFVEYLLGECDAMISMIGSSPMRPKDRTALLRVSLVKGAQATTAIEGNTLTQEEVERIYGGESLPVSRKYQQIEIQNVLDGFNYILQKVVRDKEDWRVTPELVQDFHRRITKDLGQTADCIPGKWREDRRQVGPYLAPEHRYVTDLIQKLCKWLRKEFHYPEDTTFKTAVVEAIVAHVYIEWIHPFGDGNGRTGRLVEFFVLLRAGLPDVASHILSNFYNQTRPEYYSHLNTARKEKDLTRFITYAAQGLKDGLTECLKTVQNGQLKIFWINSIYETFSDVKYTKKTVFKRKRNLILSVPFEKWFTAEMSISANIDLMREYSKLSSATLRKDLAELVKFGLLVQNEKNEYCTNSKILTSYLPKKRD